MIRALFIAAAASLAAWLPAEPMQLDPQAKTGSEFTTLEASTFLRMHNAERKKVKVPPVQWSPELAAYAQEWADQLAKEGKLLHRPSEGAWKQRYGENLWIGYMEKPANSGVAAFDLWASEAALYKAGEVIPEDFSEFKAGHYTQIVWKGTQAIGAGRATIRDGERKGWIIVVCNYDPGGNLPGQSPY